MAFARRNSDQFIKRNGNGFMWFNRAARLCSRVFVTRQAAELAMERNLISWHSLRCADCNLPIEVAFVEDSI